MTHVIEPVIKTVIKPVIEQVMIMVKDELSYEDRDQINRVINRSFNNPLEQDNLSNVDYMCIIKVAGIVVGVAMIESKHKRVMQPLSKEYLFIHTVSVDPEYRSRGYCNLMIKEIVKQYGTVKSMYLSVETGLETANKGAIKCYQKNGFRLVDCLYDERNNEQILSYMVRLKKTGKRTKKKGTKKKRTKKKRTKRMDQKDQKDQKDQIDQIDLKDQKDLKWYQLF